MDERFSQLVDDATAGLQDDPELRLDVRAELATHLQQTTQAFRQEGLDEAESAAQAMRVFGSPLELADELLAANKRRMKHRALARLAIRALLVPAAVLVALWIVFFQLTQFGVAFRLYNGMSGSYPQADNTVKPDIGSYIIVGTLFLPSRYFGNEWTQVFGIGNPPINASQFSKPTVQDVLRDLPQRAYGPTMPPIAVDHPENKAYWGYYSRFYFRSPFPEVEKVSRHGEAIDPQNALYNYLRACAYLDTALEPVNAKEQHGRSTVIYRVNNPQQLAPGIEELRKGMAKPYLRTYAHELMLERYRRLPEPWSYNDYLQRAILNTAELYPQLPVYRDLSRRAFPVAEYLRAHGRKDEAAALLAFHSRLAMQLTADAEIPVTIYVARTIVREESERSILLANQLGRHDIAQQIQKIDAEFIRVVPNSQADAHIPTSEKLQRSRSILATVLMPGHLSITPADLAPTRELDYILVARIAVTYLFIFLLLCMLRVVAVSLYWRFRAHKALAPMLLLPTGRAFTRIFLMGIVLPLGIYLVYSLIPVLNGREYGILYMGNRLVIEIFLLVMALLYLPTRFAGRYVRQRCQRLGVAVPPLRFTQVQQVITAVSFPIWLIVTVGLYFGFSQWLLLDGMLVVLSICLYSLATAGLIYLLVSILRKRQPYGTYYGTMARSLIPVYTGAILLVALISQPYFTVREAQLIRQDRMVFLQGDKTGISPMESLVIKEMQQQLMPVLQQLNTQNTAK